MALHMPPEKLFQQLVSQPDVSETVKDVLCFSDHFIRFFYGLDESLKCIEYLNNPDSGTRLLTTVLHCVLCFRCPWLKPALPVKTPIRGREVSCVLLCWLKDVLTTYAPSTSS